MADELDQNEAEQLIATNKKADQSKTYYLPAVGEAIEIPLWSIDNKEPFLLDVRRGSISIIKGTNQLRSRKVIVLLRLDYNGAPHTNPDLTEVTGTHLHIFRAGYADKFAYALPDDVFHDVNDHYQTLIDFMNYCNIVQPPFVEPRLF